MALCLEANLVSFCQDPPEPRATHYCFFLFFSVQAFVDWAGCFYSLGWDYEDPYRGTLDHEC